MDYTLVNLKKTFKRFYSSAGGYIFKLLSSVSETPEIGEQYLYFKSNGKLYKKDADGVETLLEGAIAGGVTDHGNLTSLDYLHAGHTGVQGTLEFDFTYETVSPTTLINVLENVRVRKVILDIETAFNDADSSISVGHTGNVNGLLATTDNVPQTIGLYEVDSNFLYGGADIIKLYITKGSSTQGNGTVFLEIVNN